MTDGPGGPEELPTSLVAMLESHILARPDSTVLRFDGVPTTFAELGESSAAVANGLLSSGVAPQDRVAVLGRNCLEVIEVVFGIARVNAVVISVNWRLKNAEILEILEDAGAKVLVISDEFFELAELARARGVEVIAFGDRSEPIGAKRYDEWKTGAPASSTRREVGEDDVVLQLYTSGTTGRPKGVMSGNRGFLLYLRTLSGYLRFDEASVSLCTLPMFHIGGLGWLLAGVYGGAETVVLPDADVERTLDAIHDHQVTTMFAVPTVILRLIQSPLIERLDTKSLRTLYYGTGPITVPILQEAIRIFACDLIQGFGMTEIGLITVLSPSAHFENEALLRSCGQLVPGTELRLVDPETGADVELGQVGEMWVRSPRLMLGYWRDGGVDPQSFESDGWFRTGDAARVDEGGFYFLQDRIKDMIVTGGENVYSAEVENTLMSHPDVADCAVIGVPHDQWVETVKALVVPRPGGQIDADDIIAFCRDRLAHYKCPTSVDIIESLPRTPSGKVLKHMLRAKYQSNQTFV